MYVKRHLGLLGIRSHVSCYEFSSYESTHYESRTIHNHKGAYKREACERRAEGCIENRHLRTFANKGLSPRLSGGAPTVKAQGGAMRKVVSAEDDDDEDGGAPTVKAQGGAMRKVVIAEDDDDEDGGARTVKAS